jgi:hypothetical protein
MQNILTDSLIQNLLRQQRRIQRIEYNQTLHFCVIRLIKFISENSELSGIIEELKAHTENEDQVIAAAQTLVSGNGATDFDDEKQFVLRSYLVLDACARGGVGTENQASRAVSLEPSRHSVNRQAFSSIYLEPVISYLIDKLQNRQNILATLVKYKQKAEWFQRTVIRDQIDQHGDSRIEEKVLNPKIYEYLHDAGIEFYIEPHSQESSGRPDFVSAQSSEPKLILDGKYLDVVNTAKQKIVAASSQVYQYTYDFNRPDGYIVLFKKFQEDIVFSFPVSDFDLPVVTRNGKKIYFVVVSIADAVSPSQSRRLSEIQITEEDLTRSSEL